MDRSIELVGAFVGWCILVLALGALFALPTQLLWNGCLVPAVPGVHEVGFWQAWGLMILCSLLFKNTSSKSD